jgi:hypothetical protein
MSGPILRFAQDDTSAILPPMTDLQIEAAHRVSVAVMHADGRLVASAGDPARVAFWRSAAKPFQALPLVDDGAADAVGLTPAELALACASARLSAPRRTPGPGRAYGWRECRSTRALRRACRAADPEHAGGTGGHDSRNGQPAFS